MQIPFLSRFFQKKMFKPSKPVVRIKLGKAIIAAELSKSTFQKARGLMFKNSLAEGRGMLFDFGAETRPAMWMFGMLFSIDMLWLDEGFRIVHIEKDAKPFAIWKIYTSKKNARYVLEVKSGFCQKNNISVGHYAEFC